MLTEELAALARFHQFDETQLDGTMLYPVQKGVELVMINITHQHCIDLTFSKPASNAASIPAMTWLNLSCPVIA